MTEVGHCPPISDYALISDMHSCCLVSRAGSIDWCCFPRLDSAAIFSRILDWGKGGYFHVAPVPRLAVEGGIAPRLVRVGRRHGHAGPLRRLGPRRSALRAVRLHG